MIVLAELKYDFGMTHKKFIALIIGKTDKKLIMILDDFIKDEELKDIKLNMKRISGWPLNNRIQWFKNNTPKAYKGYREIYLNRIKIISYHSFK